MHRLKIINNERGDTIMEVLICVAMLGFMLGAAFSLTNRNQLTSRASQERGEANRLAEKQVEYLRTYYAKNPGVTPADDNFCFNNDGAYTANGSPSADKANDTDDAEYVTTCKDNRNGYDYKISFWKADLADTKSVLGSKGSAHVVTVRWDNVRGGDQEEVKMFYTIDQVSAGAYGAGISVLNDGIDTCLNITGFQATPPSGTFQYEDNCPASPVVKVAVKKVAPGPGNTTPSCGGVLQSIANIPVRLTDSAGTVMTVNTDVTSTASFLTYQFNKNYTASYTVPANYQVCPPATATVATNASPGAIYNTSLSIRPICWGQQYSPVYGYYVAYYNPVPIVGTYQYSIWHGKYQFGAGPGPVQISGSQWRWYNGNPAINNRATQSLYDYYAVSYRWDPVFAYGIVSYQDTRACP